MVFNLTVLLSTHHKCDLIRVRKAIKTNYSLTYQISRMYRKCRRSSRELSPRQVTIDRRLTSGVINGFRRTTGVICVIPRHARRYLPRRGVTIDDAVAAPRMPRMYGMRRHRARITHASLTHRQAPYARPPGEWSLPEGAPVVGAGTARHVSHPWSRRTCGRTRVARHEGSRCRVETELPTCREATYIRRARGESPPSHPSSSSCSSTSLPPSHPRLSRSYRTPSRARARPYQRGCSDRARRSSLPQQPAPFIPLRRAVTRSRRGWDPLVTGHHSPFAPTFS